MFYVKKQSNILIRNAFLDALASAIAPQTKVTLITDAGFHNEWFRRIRALGWDFIGRTRNIWEQVRWRVQKKRNATDIFIFIKKRRKAE